MTSPARPRVDAVIIGGGIAGIVTALELLDAGKQVLLLERGDEKGLGGLAMQAFGGMALVDTPLQRRSGIRDSAAIALADWHSFAEFGPGDEWPRRWAEHYVTRCVPEVYEWLTQRGLRFIPAVQWVERGWLRRGNTLPRYHVLWGTSQHMIATLLQALRAHPRRAALQILCGHTVHELMLRDHRVIGCMGIDAATRAPFEVEADHVVVASGGITGNLARVRDHWPRDWGAPPQTLLNGSHPQADGLLHDATAAVGGRVTHLDQMWTYAAGVHHPRPQFPGHGLSLIPCKSALWMDHQGRRIGPEPLVTCYDTHAMVERIARGGYPYTWQILNRRIAVRELAASGAEHNPVIRDRRVLAFAWQLLRGNTALVDELTNECHDFVVAPTLPELVRRMNALIGNDWVSAEVLESEIRPYDEQIARGRRFHNDEQLRRIAHLRQWLGDRLRTCAFQRILDPDAGPLIAIREFILTRKSMGGIQTDLGSRVIGVHGAPIPGLLAAGEAAGFGGGGANGKRSLEGTFLSGCILTARAAARTVAGHQ
jgi:predicted oxidoreductase